MIFLYSSKKIEQVDDYNVAPRIFGNLLLAVSAPS